VLKRRRQIVELVKAHGFVSVEGLARQFSVTPQTIRRDIKELSAEGLIRRYHGGAGLPSSVENISYATRKVMQLEEKRRIAQTLARYIPDSASVFINIGTTTEEVAKALLDHRFLRVITNNLNVATILSQKEDFEVLIAGGLVRSKDRGVTGEETISFIRQFKADFGIIGISGIDMDGTLLDFDYREVRVAKEIIANSVKVFLAADHTKFGRNAMVRLCSLNEIDRLFTDRRPCGEMMEMLSRLDIGFHIADEELHGAEELMKPYGVGL
jgi:DeoR family glycerol-3-phosphate regulon repressor